MKEAYLKGLGGGLVDTFRSNRTSRQQPNRV